MKSDFYMAITQIAAERGIPREAVIESVEHAIRKVYRKTANIPEPEEGAVDNVDVAINPGDGGIRVFVRYTIADQVEDQHSQIALQDALRLDQAYISTIHGFGLRVLTEFAFEGGQSPVPRLLSEDEQDILIRQALARTQKAEIVLADLSAFGYRYDFISGLSAAEVFRRHAFATAYLRDHVV